MVPAMTDPKSILVTGASSGIGAALARAYAGPGVTLALCGRDTQRLNRVAADCREKGAIAEATGVDVTDAEATAHWIAAADSAAPLDLVIATPAFQAARSAAANHGSRRRRSSQPMSTASSTPFTRQPNACVRAAAGRSPS